MKAGPKASVDDSPLLCGLVKAGMVEPRAYRQNETFAAAVQFAHTEGIIPALESSHAIAWALADADSDLDVICLSGRGDKDLTEALAKLREGE